MDNPRDTLLAWALAAGATEEDAAKVIGGLVAEEREACARTVESWGIEFVANAAGSEVRGLAYTSALMLSESAARIRERGPTRAPLPRAEEIAAAMKRARWPSVGEPGTGFLAGQFLLLKARVEELEAKVNAEVDGPDEGK